MKKILFLAALFACSYVHSTTLTLGGWSHHFDSNYDYCESHNMISVNHKGYVLGTFTNSYCEKSYLAAYQYDYGRWQFTAGASTGYGDYDHCPFKNGAKLCPAFSIMYKFQDLPIKAGLFGGAFAVAFEFKL